MAAAAAAASSQATIYKRRKHREQRTWTKSRNAAPYLSVVQGRTGVKRRDPPVVKRLVDPHLRRPRATVAVRGEPVQSSRNRTRSGERGKQKQLMTNSKAVQGQGGPCTCGKVRRETPQTPQQAPKRAGRGGGSPRRGRKRTSTKVTGRQARG